MIAVDIIDQGTIDTTLPATSDPIYQLAALALTIRQQLAAFRAAGLQFTRVETTDLSSFNSDMSVWLGEANTRFDEWLSGNVASVAATLPDVLSLGAAFVSGGASEAGALILQRVLGLLFHREDSRAQWEGAHSDVDFTALIAKLEQIRLLLTKTESEGIGETLEKALIDLNALSERYSILWNVSRQPIRLTVDNGGSYDDISIEDS